MAKTHSQPVNLPGARPLMNSLQLLLVSCLTDKQISQEIPRRSWSLKLTDLFFIIFLRFVTQLLSDLVYFVTEHDTGREDVLNISVQNPNRDRQKLMREQYILKEVSNNYVKPAG